MVENQTCFTVLYVKVQCSIYMYVLDFNLSTNAYGWTVYLHVHGFRSIANLIAKKNQ